MIDNIPLCGFQSAARNHCFRIVGRTISSDRKRDRLYLAASDLHSGLVGFIICTDCIHTIGSRISAALNDSLCAVLNKDRIVAGNCAAFEICLSTLAIHNNCDIVVAGTCICNLAVPLAVLNCHTAGFQPQRIGSMRTCNCAAIQIQSNRLIDCNSVTAKIHISQQSEGVVFLCGSNRLGQRLIIGITDFGSGETGLHFAHSTVGILSNALRQILAHIAGERAASNGNRYCGTRHRFIRYRQFTGTRLVITALNRHLCPAIDMNGVAL